MLTWYLPTIRGDIRLERAEPTPEERTILTAKELSPSERLAIEELRSKATSWFRHWISTGDFERAMARFKDGGELRIELDAPVEHVQAVLARMLKPGRRLLSVAIAGDRLEEVWRSDAEVIPGRETPYRGTEPEIPTGATPTPPPPPPKPKVEPPPPPPPKAEKATTVAQPVSGCPAPDFPDGPKERADRVLQQFLSPEQYDDYRRYGAFISTGFDSGHRYALVSRDERTLLRQMGGRTLSDLDRGRSYCVHDWSVPPGEELLALHAFLSVPRGETYLTGIPGDVIAPTGPIQTFWLPR